jgi:apolipoprotein N-acyltransferase
MPSNKIPVFRKAVNPWYQSKMVYGLTITFMLFVLLFGWVGISVTGEIEQYHDYVWVPIVLVVLSTGVMLSAIIRLIRRHYLK